MQSYVIRSTLFLSPFLNDYLQFRRAFFFFVQICGLVENGNICLLHTTSTSILYSKWVFHFEMETETNYILINKIYPFCDSLNIEMESLMDGNGLMLKKRIRTNGKQRTQLSCYIFCTKKNLVFSTKNWWGQWRLWAGHRALFIHCMSGLDPKSIKDYGKIHRILLSVHMPIILFRRFIWIRWTCSGFLDFES